MRNFLFNSSNKKTKANFCNCYSVKQFFFTFHFQGDRELGGMGPQVTNI